MFNIDVLSVQLEVFEVNLSPDLQQQLASVSQELGVQIPPPVSPPELIPSVLMMMEAVTAVGDVGCRPACRRRQPGVSGSREDGDI